MMYLVSIKPVSQRWKGMRVAHLLQPLQGRTVCGTVTIKDPDYELHHRPTPMTTLCQRCSSKHPHGEERAWGEHATFYAPEEQVN